jgi:uncharacterized protein
METILFTLGAFLVAVLIMSVGILFKRKPIAGSCGGIANLMGSCDICEKKSECIEKNKPQCSDHAQDECH